MFRFPGIDQYKVEAEAFVRAATGCNQKLFTLEESVSNQKLIDAVFKAGKSGEWEAVG